MQELPKIVAQRLRASRSVMDHPDPNVLTAFSERLLPESERAIVLEHLSRCDDCREVVVLALPVMEEAVVAGKSSPARAGWLSLPVLRWGAVAAAVVLIATVVLMQRQAQRPRMSKFAELKSDNKIADARAQSSAPLENSAPPAAMMPRADAPKDAASTEPKQALVARSPAKMTASSGMAAGAMAGPSAGDKVDRSKQQLAEGFKAERTGPRRSLDELKMSAPRPAEPATAAPASSQPNVAQQNAPGAVSEVVEVEAAAQGTQVLDQSQAQSQDQLAKLQNEGDLQGQQQTGRDTAKRYEKTKSAMLASATPAAPAAALGGGLGATALLWSISSSGALLRSSDGGKTWQPVDVSGNAMVAGYFATETVAKEARAKKADKMQKQAAPAMFRAVAAAGLDVWAGGSAAVLYHSSDGGTSWTRIVPTSSGVVLSGDILSVEFADTQHGKLATSTSEVWTTSDRGLTWQKQ